MLLRSDQTLVYGALGMPRWLVLPFALLALVCKPQQVHADTHYDWLGMMEATPQTRSLVNNNGLHPDINAVVVGKAQGRQLAVIPIEGGGSAGALSIVIFEVLTDWPGDARYLDRVDLNTGLKTIYFFRGNLHVVTADFAPSDSNCCPSGHYDTVYTWTGYSFVPKSSTIMRAAH